MRMLLRMLRMPPDCRQVGRVLQAYLDGELPEERLAEVAEHLRHCDRCGIEADVYREVKRSLGQVAPPPSPSGLERLRAYARSLTDGSPPPPAPR